MDLLAARAVMVLHLGFLAYVLVGGFLAWRWPWTLALHVAATGWGLASVLVHLACPLTALEDEFRQRAGAPPLTGGFIDHYLEGVVFPERYTPAVLAAVAALVVLSWAGLAGQGRSGEVRPGSSGGAAGGRS
jgi:hypothetical protein